MRVTMICGSPRGKGSTSMYLLKFLQDKLGGHGEAVIYQISDGNMGIEKDIVRDMPGSGALVIAFPLYVDSLPSNVLGFLAAAEKAMADKKGAVKVYVIVNNGFYDAIQNRIAIDSLWKWCEKCGLEKGYAVGVGAGEMAQAAPLGHGPSANLGKAMDKLAVDILKGVSGETVFVEPNFPRFLYKAAGHMRWRRQAKKNGLKISDVRRSLKDAEQSI